MGAGLLLRRPQPDADARPWSVSSHWTHLLPAFLIGGLGVGLINPAARLDRDRPSSRPRQARHGVRGSTAPSARSASPPANRPRSARFFTSKIRAHVTAGLHAVHLGGASAPHHRDLQRANLDGDRSPAPVRSRAVAGAVRARELHREPETTSSWSLRSSRSRRGRRADPDSLARLRRTGSQPQRRGCAGRTCRRSSGRVDRFAARGAAAASWRRGAVSRFVAPGAQTVFVTLGAQTVS